MYITLSLPAVLGSVSAGLWRFLLMPLDSVKTTLQVQGSAKGIEQVKARLREEGVASLYAGAVAQALATAVRGHAPGFGWNGMTFLGQESNASCHHTLHASLAATQVGHWPYFSTFNYLSSRIPVPPEGQLLQRLGRNAFLGA